MVDANFIRNEVKRPIFGKADDEYLAECGVCGSNLGRRASFPEGFTVDYISCHACGASNRVARKRCAA